MQVLNLPLLIFLSQSTLKCITVCWTKYLTATVSFSFIYINIVLLKQVKIRYEYAQRYVSIRYSGRFKCLWDETSYWSCTAEIMIWVLRKLRTSRALPIRPHHSYFSVGPIRKIFFGKRGNVNFDALIVFRFRFILIFQKY